MDDALGVLLGLASVGLVLMVVIASVRRMDEEKERQMHRAILRVVLLEPQFMDEIADLTNVYPPEDAPLYTLGLLRRGMLRKLQGGRVAITDPGMRYLEVLEGE